jgi:prepilin-type N-terminal cleavage/methylation domain-containing protein
MKTKGFTLIELLVTLVIVSVIATITFSIVRTSVSGDDDVDYSFINPELETARSQRRMAEEMQRQNDLLQRRLELLEQQNAK